MSDSRLGFFDDFLHLLGRDDVVVGPESEGVMECIRDVGPHVVGQISFSQDFPDGHVLKRGNDPAAGKAAAEFTKEILNLIVGQQHNYD